jgi:predicted ATPase
MRVLATQGRRAAAFAQYERCRQVLDEELGVEPDAETVHLYQQLKRESSVVTETPHALDAPRPIAHNLPEIATPFFGRETELAQISQQLEAGSYRLLSLVGPGGIGKTRLAQEAARANLHRFPDGVYVVPLAAVHTAEDVPLAIAEELGMTLVTSDQAVHQQVLAKLRRKTMLLVLDNLEQLLADTETSAKLIDLLRSLLQQATGLTLLVTSREHLDVQIEDIYHVHGLPVPHESDLATASQFAAVRLFCERVYRRHKSFKLTADNLPHIRAICQLVEGMPLGLELAATWTHRLDWARLVTELEHNAIRLHTTLRDMAPQHHSLAIAFDHSWRLLRPAEQDVLRQLAVFAGGFSRTAAQQVTGASLVTLTRLSYKSLIRTAGSDRYDMHTLVWQFAREKLHDQAALEQTTRQHHGDYFLTLVGTRSDALHGATPHLAMTDIRRDLDNIRQAWQWCLDRGDVAALWTSGCLVGLSRFFQASGLSAEGERLFRQALQRLDTVGTDGDPQPLRQHLLVELAELLIRQSKFNSAIACATEALALAESRHDLPGQARGRQVLGYAYDRHSHSALAHDHLEAGLKLVRQTGQTALEGEILRHLGNNTISMGDRSRGERYLQEALHIHRSIGNRAQEQAVLLYLGVSRADQYDHLSAWNYYQQALQLVQTTGDRYLESRIENALGFELAAMGNLDAAVPHHQRSRQIAQEIDDPTQESHALHNLCTVKRKQGRLEEAEAYGREALRLGQVHQLVEPEACAWLHLGYVLLERAQLAAAATAFDHSRTSWLTLDQMPLVIEATAGLAAVAWHRGDPDEALAQTETVLNYLDTQPLYGGDEPFQVYVTCYQILHAHDDPRAAQILAEARQQIESRLALLPDEQTRHAFLTNIPAHRTLMGDHHKAGAGPA